MKKLLAAALCGSMAASLALTGCSTAGTSGNASGGSKDDVTLLWYTEGDQPDDLQLVLDKLNPILKEKIGATVDIRFVSNADYDEKMTSVINSGEAFDICFTCDWANSYAINARKGAYLDLTPYLDGDNKALKEAIDSRFWEGVTIDGKIYGVPANKELPYAPVWAFTKELVDKYSLDIDSVTDLASLEPLLKTIKENEPEIIPLPLRASDIPGIIDQYDIPAARELPAYVRYDDETRTVVNPFEQEDVLKNLHTIHDYFVKGYINQDAATNKQKLKNRLIYCGWYCPGAEEIWGNQAGYEVVCRPRYENYYSTTSCIGSLQAVSANSKHPAEAVKFLELLNTDPEIKNLVTYGIEGTHYEKTSDTSIKLLEASSRYTTDYYTLGNELIMYTVDPQAHDLWDQYRAFNDASKPSVLVGFSFNNENVKTEYASVMNITAQYLPQLFTGSATDVDQTVAEMNKKLYDAGLQKIIDDMQKQIDEWAANKK